MTKIKEVKEEKHISQARAINSQGHVARIFAEWSHGVDFVEQARAYCKENDFKLETL